MNMPYFALQFFDNRLDLGFHQERTSAYKVNLINECYKLRSTLGLSNRSGGGGGGRHVYTLF